MESIEVRANFSSTILSTLEKKNLSKRWLYLKLEMTAQTFDARLKNNDWRLGEIIKVTELLGL